MKKIILASSSPRRQHILQELGLIFDIIEPEFEENTSNLKFSYKVIESFALGKAKSVVQKINEPALIISADTMVVHKDEILGKPYTEENAILMLEKLNGKHHKVITALAIIDTHSKTELVETVTSGVFFNKLESSIMLKYIQDYKPFDKAGSYGIQELPKCFIKSIDGEFDNIIGLPSKTLIKMLTKLNK